jgi:hypothetical protein
MIPTSYRRHGEGEHQRAKIQTHLIHARQIHGCGGNEHANGRVRHCQPREGAGQGDRQALGQHLPHHSPRTSSQRRSHRHLAPTSRGARQHQVAEIHAHDQQYCANRCQQNQQSAARAGHNFFLQWSHVGAQH